MELKKDGEKHILLDLEEDERDKNLCIDLEKNEQRHICMDL